jgi:hypothetical protein
MDYKRILKTGALAAVVTIIFGVFAYRVAEWSKGLNSDFLVSGQTGGPGSGESLGTTRIIPQVAVGPFGPVSYATIVQLVNTNSTAVTVTANFYNEQGSALGLTFGTNASTPQTFVGTLNSFSLQPNGVFVISAGNSDATTPSTGTVGWGKNNFVRQPEHYDFFELRDTALKILYSRVGVGSPANMKVLLCRVPTMSPVDWNCAFAIVNTGSTKGVVHGSLRDAGGAELKAADVTLAPGQHRALLTNEFFYPPNGVEPALPLGTNFHYVTLSSSAASIAATAIGFEGGTQTSFPIDRLE